jgi:hypothetical protein
MQSLVGNCLTLEISLLPSRTQHYGSSTLGKFIGDWSRVHTGEMNWTQLKLLIEGIEPGRQRKRYQQTEVGNKPCVSAPLSAPMG